MRVHRPVTPSPGTTPLSGHPMPDIWVTAENDWGTYEAGWAGGNLLTGGTWGTTYVDGNSYYPGAFRHIIHDAQGGAEMEAAVDLAEARGAAGVFVTDDVMANPYDVEPSYDSGTYAVDASRSSSLRSGLFADYNDTEAMLVYARNRVVAGYQDASDDPGHAANCIGGASPIPLPYRFCP